MKRKIGKAILGFMDRWFWSIHRLEAFCGLKKQSLSVLAVIPNVIIEWLECSDLYWDN